MSVSASKKAGSRASKTVQTAAQSSEILTDESGVGAVDARESKVYIGANPPLKNWKMYGDLSQDEAAYSEDGQEAQTEKVHPRGYAERRIGASSPSVRPVAPVWLQIGQALAVFVTVAWLTYAAIYIMALPNSMKSITSSPLTLGGILASVLAPIAMLWLCIATWQRRSDAHIYAQALREELRGLLFPDEEQAGTMAEDIRALMKQATEMSASSRGAIKAIQRARAGLRSEIRDFAGVSQKAEFHIDRLTDALAKRAEELLSLTETIEAQTESITAKAQRGVSVWENVSEEIGELGNEIDNIFTKGTESLTGASDAALARIHAIESTLSGAVENLSSRIGSVAVQIETTRTTLDDQADRLLTVSDAINGGADRLEGSVANAEKISAAVEEVMDVMTTSLGKVESTAETLFERTDSIEKRLEERADMLKESAVKLLDSTESLKEVGATATDKLGEALSMAISGAETISNTVRRSKEMMERTVGEASVQIEESSKLADVKMKALMAEAAANRDYLRTVTDDIEGKQLAFARSAKEIEESRVHLTAIADIAIATMNAAAEDMVTKAQQPLDILKESVDRLGDRTRELDDKLAVRVVEVERETSKLKEAVDNISLSMKTSLQDIAQTTGLATSQSKVIADEISGQRENLKSIADDLQAKTRIVADLLDEQSRSFTTSLENAESQISLLGQSFFDRSDALLSKVATVSDKVGDYDVRLTETLRAVEGKSQTIADNVRVQIEQIDRLVDKVGPESSSIITQAERIGARYEDLRSGCLKATDEAISCLSDLGDKLESRIGLLGSETLETSKVFLTVTEDMTASLAAIKDVSEEAQESMNRIQSGVKGRIDDLQLVTDQVKLKVEGMQNNLDVYIKDLSGIVGRAVNDLEVATDKFGMTTSVLDDKAQAVTVKILDATRQYIEEGHRVSMIGEQAAHKASRIVAVIQEESERLSDASKTTLADLQKSGDTLSVRARELEEYLKSSIIHAKTYGEELRGQASLISNVSLDIVEQISSASSRLVGRVNDVKSAGASVIEDIEVSRQKLSDEASRLGSVARKTIESADEAAIVFTKHSESLQKSVVEMVDQAKKVRDGQSRTERDAFLTAAKFVIESLFSLSVDVARHLEGELDMRVLRAYQKGDVSAYTRHLVDIVPKIPTDKSQRKFIDDSEFRTYVLRFIRQYEELLEQAQSNDYADLLTSVFSTSDIGKLYKNLCAIAGRNAREH